MEDTMYCSVLRGATVATAAVALVMLAACSSSSKPAATSSGSTAAASSATTSAAAALITSTPSATSADWVTWDKTSCKFIPATSHPAAYTANVRKAATPFTLGFGQQGTGNPLLDAMNADMSATAGKAGLTLAIGNYNYPDKTDAISQSQAIALRNPAAVVSFNVDATILDTLNKTYSDKCIPIIQVTLPATNAVVFGASDDGVGTAEGAYLVNYAKQQGWAASDILAYGVQVPSLANINRRVTTCQSTITAAFSGAKSDSASILTSTTANAQTATTNWLTAHPDVKHLLGCNISDSLALGEVNALTAANRGSGSAILGAGGTASVLALVGKSSFIGSVDFGYGHYGDFLVGMAQDVVEGKPLPTAVYTPLKVITSAS
jgi:ribose transport system substrate-binding protein